MKGTIRNILTTLLLLVILIFGTNFVLGAFWDDTTSPFFNGNAPSGNGTAPSAPGTPIGVNTTDHDLVIGDNAVEVFNFTIWYNGSVTNNVTSINFSIFRGNITLNDSHSLIGAGSTNGSAVFNNTIQAGTYVRWQCNNLTSTTFDVGGSAGGKDYFCRTNGSGSEGLTSGPKAEHWRPTNISAFWFVVKSAPTAYFVGNATEVPGNLVINITLNATGTLASFNSTQVRLTVDSVSPRINLTTPVNNTWVNTRLINFSFIAKDNFLKNCTLWLDVGLAGTQKNASTTVMPNGTEFGRDDNDGIKVGNDTINNLTINNVPDNATGYIWSVGCYDRVHHFNVSFDNRTLKVDATKPSMTGLTSSLGTGVNKGALSTLKCDIDDIAPDFIDIDVTGESSVVKRCNEVTTCNIDYTFGTAGTKTVTCTAQDKAGNTNTNTITVDVSSSGDTTTTGTSGSGGASSSVTINTQTPNQEIKYTPNSNEIGVNEVTFTADKPVNNAKLTLKSLTQPTTGTPTPTTTVYKYFEVNKNNFGDAKVTKADITFTVADTWLTQNGLTKENIQLMKYDESWKELPTTYVKQQSGYHHYKAQTTGFSLFAIATKTNTDTTTPAETTTQETAAETTTPAETTNKLPLLLVLVVLVVIIGIVYYVLKKRNE